MNDSLDNGVHGLDRGLVQVRIKRNPVLRHVLAHLHQAISLTADGFPDAAISCLSEIEDSIFFEDDDAAENEAARWLTPHATNHGDQRKQQQNVSTPLNGASDRHFCPNKDCPICFPASELVVRTDGFTCRPVADG